MRLDFPRGRRVSSEQQRSKVGFPIRRFTDQSLFAAPHDLSQRTTSFIASQRQGIHQTPLRHLIALIAKPRQEPDPSESVYEEHAFPDRLQRHWREKTSFASNASGGLSGQARKPTTGCSRTTRRAKSAAPRITTRRQPIPLTRLSTECASSSQCQISKKRQRLAEASVGLFNARRQRRLEKLI